MSSRGSALGALLVDRVEAEAGLVPVEGSAVARELPGPSGCMVAGSKMPLRSVG
ncbi:hypothetical protein [Streptomyces humi]|uniref:hypothetical protein n=1 Tax=Streptomyces humi TaxID=1428620 RepID=UPI00142D43D2|nr:hypothetical protein [Streptomyces humi]